jgi:Lysyl oxidase
MPDRPPLVVEGFRRPGESVMDAYQYFRDEDGDVVGRAAVGEMAFHSHPEHNQGSLSTNCGSPSALWVREVLQTGWADTYFQGIPGQSFDITTVPNGWYYARLEVNPFGALHEVTRANNVESRLVTSADGAGTGRCLQHRGTASWTDNA